MSELHAAFCVALHLMNVASSTPPTTLQLCAVTAALCYATLCIWPGRLLGQISWNSIFCADFATDTWLCKFV